MLLLTTTSSFLGYPLPRSHRHGGFEKKMFPSTSYSFLFQIKAVAHMCVGSWKQSHQHLEATSQGKLPRINTHPLPNENSSSKKKVSNMMFSVPDQVNNFSAWAWPCRKTTWNWIDAFLPASNMWNLETNDWAVQFETMGGLMWRYC